MSQPRGQVSDWQYIPEQAFLYFPQGEDIIMDQDKQQKQWRKIFESGQPYNTLQLRKLQKLEQSLKEQKQQLDPWFDDANKLRFIQANKFKSSQAMKSMLQTTKFRKQNYPIKSTPNVQRMLNSGAFYICGRDNKYRPIIIADIGKFKEDDVEDIPSALIVLMEFIIQKLLIAGQVENYILIMNMQQAGFGMRNVITKILGFTSNAYRGRLFASYLLSMPTMLNWTWNALISKFVSQNTLRKIKVTGEAVNEQMWTHISKQTIQTKYGGTMKEIVPTFPPNKQLLLFVDNTVQKNNKLVEAGQYRQMYRQGRLANRKILKKIVQQSSVVNETAPLQVPQQANNNLSASKLQSPRASRTVYGRSQIRSNAGSSRANNAAISSARLQVIVKSQTSFIKDYLTIKTFFQTDKFKRICGELPRK